MNNIPLIGRDKVIEIGKELLPDFKIEGCDIQNYEKLYYYFTKNELKCTELGIDLKKFLWIFGDVGCGKTIAMKVFQDFCFYTQHLGNRRFSIYWFTKIVKEHNNSETRPLISQMYGCDCKKDLCFDDFLKNTEIKHYGNTENIAELLISERYEAFSNHGVKTHLTTNISPNIAVENKLIGKRELDRCSQMFNIIKWEGGSKR